MMMMTLFVLSYMVDVFLSSYAPAAIAVKYFFSPFLFSHPLPLPSPRNLAFSFFLLPNEDNTGKRDL